MKTSTKERIVILATAAAAGDTENFLRRLLRAVQKQGWTPSGNIEQGSCVSQDAENADIFFADGKRVSLEDALASPCGIVAAGIDKSALDEAMQHLESETPVIIDLDETGVKKGLRRAKRKIAAEDAERIGAFAGISGLMEVGLGSTLHVYRVPLKGHFLSSLQNLLLITFGKALKGRGLVRISFISAMLKAFSPMGGRFRPMLYIFLQGLAFASPSRLLGWHAGSVLLGSVFLAWLTLGISLSVNYATFGQSIFDAFSGAAEFVSRTLGVESPSLMQLIVGAFALKAFIAVIIASLAYFGNMQPLVRKLGRLKSRRKKQRTEISAAGQSKDNADRGIPSKLLSALTDLLRPRFVIMFLLSILLMRFFADLSQSALTSLVIRGLTISYLGFLLMRQIDLQALGVRLDRLIGMDLGKSLPIALKIIGKPSCPPEDAEDK
jgi:hypothetical protein